MQMITETSELGALCAELERGPYVALDTEFMRDQTYWPKLCLIQAAGTNIEAIIDPMAEGIHLSPFYKLLAAKKVVKVFHAGTRLDNGQVVTDGGRVLGVTALGNSISAAKLQAYTAVKCIRWSGAWCRKDISDKALLSSSAGSES